MSIISKYIESNQTSKKIYEKAVKVLPSGNTRNVLFYPPYPVYAKRGKGSRIWDVDGNERIDYCFNYLTLILGHAHPKVTKAIMEQLKHGTVLGQPTEAEVKFAEKITNVVPCAEMVRFSVTGTEAIMHAIRAARAYTGRDKIVMFEGSYHGTSDPVVVKDSANPSEGIPQGIAENSITTPFNNIEAFEKTLTKLKSETAAVLMEPFLGVGGMIGPNSDFLKAVRELTEKYDILLILDEVMSGFRLALGGAQEFFGVKPEMAVFGKVVTGGLPGSVITGSKEIMEKVFSFPNNSSFVPSKPRLSLSGTHNANPLSMVAGLATIEELKPSVYEYINEIAEYLRCSITKICSDLGVKTQVAGLGSLFHVYFTDREIVDYRDVQLVDPRLIRYFNIGLLNQGVYFSPAHVSCTSAVTTKKDVEQTIDAIEQCVRDIKPLIREICPNLVIQ